MTGWGQEGPLSTRAGHDIELHRDDRRAARDRPRGGPPQVPVNLVGDFGGGALYLAVGVLAAVLKARETGQGQVVDTAIVDGVASLLAPVYGLLSAGYWRDRRGVNLLDSGAPFYDVYETADGRYVAVGAIEPKFYAQLLDAAWPGRQSCPGSGTSAGGASCGRASRRSAGRTREQWRRSSRHRCLRRARALASRGRRRAACPGARHLRRRGGGDSAGPGPALLRDARRHRPPPTGRGRARSSAKRGSTRTPSRAVRESSEPAAPECCAHVGTVRPAEAGRHEDCVSRGTPRPSLEVRGTPRRRRETSDAPAVARRMWARAQRRRLIQGLQGRQGSTRHRGSTDAAGSRQVQVIPVSDAMRSR